MRYFKFQVILALILTCTAAYSQPLPPKVENKRDAGRVRVWSKDPFVPPAKVEPPRPDREGVPDLDISAILFSGDRSSAVINGRTVHIGSELKGLKVLDIQKTYVILGSGKKTHRLELKK